MYYANIQGSSIYIYEAQTGAIHFMVSIYGTLSSYNINGNTLSICYNDGRVEVYDVDKRYRVR